MLRKMTHKLAVSALLTALVLMLSAPLIGALGGIQDLTAHGGGTTGALAIAQTLVGDGITVTSATFAGDPTQIGTFTTATNQLGFEDGIVLSSGAVDGIHQGHDVVLSVETFAAGDPDLTILADEAGAGGDSRDAAVLNLTFTTTANWVYFRYVFASEEYEEFIDAGYNDVFGFYVNGQNCALINDVPISIDSINPNRNAEHYRSNTTGQIPGIAFDGLTKILTCAAPVNPNQANTLKLAISDISDGIFDSAVFIKAASFTTRPEVEVADVSATEGSTVALVGTVNDPDSPDVTVNWMIDDIAPAAVNCTLLGPATLAATLSCDDQAAVIISLTVDDGVSAASSDTGVVTFTNVNPTIANVDVQRSGNSIQLTAVASDPSNADTAAGLTYRWSVNNGPVVTGPNPMNTQFNQALTGQIVHVVAVDKDGGASTPYVVPVVSAMDLLIALRADVQSSQAPQEAKSRLLTQLGHVRVMLILQQHWLTAVHLDIFIARVGMFSRAGVSRHDAADFVQQAEAIKDILGY